jgi:hypothetical protein
MAKEQTNKSRYPSRYSPNGFVTAAQYIIELVCEQEAIKQKKELPVKFWNLPEWRLIFAAQLRAVHSLLKKYSPQVIIKVVKEKRYNNLRPKWVEEAIAQEQILANTIKTKENISDKIVNIREQTDIKLPEQKVKSTKLSKLIDLDE